MPPAMQAPGVAMHQERATSGTRSTDFRALTQSDLDNVAAELRRANHHDPVMTSHLAMNEPGRIAKIRTAKQEDNQ